MFSHLAPNYWGQMEFFYFIWPPIINIFLLFSIWPPINGSQMDFFFPFFTIWPQIIGGQMEIFSIWPPISLEFFHFIPFGPQLMGAKWKYYFSFLTIWPSIIGGQMETFFQMEKFFHLAPNFFIFSHLAPRVREYKRGYNLLGWQIFINNNYCTIIVRQRLCAECAYCILDILLFLFTLTDRNLGNFTLIHQILNTTKINPALTQRENTGTRVWSVKIKSFFSSILFFCDRSILVTYWRDSYTGA